MNLFKYYLVVSSMWWTFELIITWTVVVQVVFGKDISILEYLVTSSFQLISSKWLSYAWQRFSKKRWDKGRYMRSPCNDIFLYTVIHWDFVYIMHGRGLPIFWKVYMYIYWIFCDFIALRYQTWFISFDQDFHEYYE